MMTTNPLLRKRIIIMLVFLFVVFGGIVAWNVIKSVMIKKFFSTYEAPAVTISSTTAKATTWYPTLSAVGNFVAINGVDVNAQTSGNIVKIHFKSGEIVSENQALINIDDSILQAQLEFNQAELTLKKINYKRQIDLYKRGATPKSSLDTAKANMEQAQANLDKTQAEITQKHIKAPFSGRLGIRLVNLGQYVSPGQTAIVSLQSLDPLFLMFYLPEQYLNRIHKNQTILISVENYPDVLFKGKISAINSKVDSTTHNVQVQATLPNCSESALENPDKSSLIKYEKSPGYQKKIILCDTALNQKKGIKEYAFIPGVFATIDVVLPPVKNQIILPSTAISYSLYGNSVYIIEKDGKGKKDKNGKTVLRVKRAFVKTGEQRGNQVIIEKGVSPGQEVVSSGEIKLQNGTAVKINNAIALPSSSDIDELGQ